MRARVGGARPSHGEPDKGRGAGTTEALPEVQVATLADAEASEKMSNLCLTRVEPPCEFGCGVCVEKCAVVAAGIFSTAVGFTLGAGFLVCEGRSL